MNHQKIADAHRHFVHWSSVVILLYIVVVFVVALMTRFTPVYTATNCTIDANLVNTCRPWLGATVGNYPGVGLSEYDLKAQVLDHERRIGRQLDMVHSYATPTKPPLSTTDRYFINRADTILYATWKPSQNWGAAGGSDATVNANIDKLADSLKSVAPKKVLLGIFHEPENDVSGGATGCTRYIGSSGTPTEYRAMWRNVYNRLNAKGVSNAVYVMNYMGFSEWNCMIDDLWPGNDIVDWVMWDPYSESVTWSGMIQPFYDSLQNLSNTQNDYKSKTWGLAEWGAWRSSTRTNTYRLYDGARTALSSGVFPRIKSYVAFDYGDSRVAYDAQGVYDQTEMDKYKQFANHAVFNAVSSSAPAPQPTPDPTPTPPPASSPAPSPTPQPTAEPKKTLEAITVSEKPAMAVTEEATVTVGDKVVLNDTLIANDSLAKSIERVEYYVGGTLKYTASAAPYVLDTSVLGIGSHDVTERVIMKDGSSTESKGRIVVAKKSGIPSELQSAPDKNVDTMAWAPIVIGSVVGGAALVGLVGAITHNYWMPTARRLVVRRRR